MVEFEADDDSRPRAATAARDARVERVIICTPDNHLAQCVRGTRIVQLNRRTLVTLDEAAIVRKFGVSPASIPDYLALVGDAADGWMMGPHAAMRGSGGVPRSVTSKERPFPAFAGPRLLRMGRGQARGAGRGGGAFGGKEGGSPARPTLRKMMGSASDYTQVGPELPVTRCRGIGESA
jgi:hypothetical protein